MRYGIPYIGSKNKIAEWVVSNLPKAETFVDLFAGGCAVTHCAMLSGKYKKFIANDISGSVILFKEAINGDFDGFASIPNRDLFMVSDDLFIKLLWSYGNKQTWYAYAQDIEELKYTAEKMICSPSTHERRNYYKLFMNALYKTISTGNEKAKEICMDKMGKDPLERLSALERLERVFDIKNTPGLLDVTISDYKNVNIPKNSVVYADPPYRGVGFSYDTGFDFDTFDKWLDDVDFPVYVSEYTAPKGCVCIAENTRPSSLAHQKRQAVTERLFVQERFCRSAVYGQTALEI